MGMNIVILGGPGSGKKTQTNLLADNYGLTVLTAGELVKRVLDEESELGSQLRLQQQAGQQVADDIILTLLQERLRQSDLGNGFILDGFPRNLLQALTLDELLGEMGLSLDFVLLFEIETDALMERLVGRRTCRSCKAIYNVYTQPTVVEDVCDLCGGRLHQRADDTEETVSSRLHVFDHLTAPLLSHYGKLGKVVRVDGEGEVDVVFARTRQAIEHFLAERAEAGTVAEQQPAPYTATPVSSEVTPGPVSADEPAAKAVADDTLATGKRPEAKPVGQKRQAERGRTRVAKPNSGGGAKKSVTTAKTQPAVAKQKAVKKVTGGQKKAVVKKGAGGKAGKRSATPAQAGGKKSPRKAVVKKTAKKNPIAKKTAAKSVVSKQTVKRKSAAGKPTAKAAAKKRVVKKVTKKQVAKKRPVSAKSKPATPKKTTVKNAPVKKSAPKRPTAKPVSKKKPVGKSKAANKPVKKQAAKKGPKRSPK
jgi:adenylate kinase